MTEEQASQLLLDTAAMIQNQQYIFAAVLVLIGVVIACTIAMIVAEVLRGL